MAFKIPVFLRDNPLESLLAVGLLVGLLFISADGTQVPSMTGSMVFATEKN